MFYKNLAEEMAYISSTVDIYENIKKSKLENKPKKVYLNLLPFMIN